MSALEPRVVPTLDELRADPVRVAELTPGEARQVAAELVTLWTFVLTRAFSQDDSRSPAMPGLDAGKMLEVREAAQLAGVTVKQFYRRRVFRPAIVKLGHRTARVSEKRLRRILDDESRTR